MTAEQLTTILLDLQRGNVQQWADLVQFALATDDLFISLYSSRITRVAQADYQIVPNKFGDATLAQLGAEFIDQQLGRVENWDKFVRNAFHAIALGYSANEMEWDRDGASRTTYVRNIHYIHPNRFRYDDQWQLRLYDHGTRCLQAQSQYGEALWPPGWIVHTHHELAGYPCDAGLMRMSIWRWLFRRWADTFWIQNLEKYGAPFIYAEVMPNTPDAVRQMIKENIVDLNIERAAVFESGGKITVVPPAMGTGQASQHELYMDFAARSLTTTWLGASDVTQPGENGSQAAVGGRISATTDPRMITDGTNFSNTLQGSLFKYLLLFNRHRFGGQMPPIPTMQLKTASDEAQVDLQDLATQNANDSMPYNVQGTPASPSLDGTLAQLPSGSASALPASVQMDRAECRHDVRQPGEDGIDVCAHCGTAMVALAAYPADVVQPAAAPAPQLPTPMAAEPVPLEPPVAEPPKRKADTALAGQQVQALKEIIYDVMDGNLPRDSGKAMICELFGFTEDQAERMLGQVGRGFVRGMGAPDPYGQQQQVPLADPNAQQQVPLVADDEFGSSPHDPYHPEPFEPEIDDPKAQGRPIQGRRTMTTPRSRARTSPTGSRSIGPLEQVLRRTSGDPVR